MARESGTTHGYLGGCLVDGAKPFHFRSRVRSLLGLPQSGNVEMRFPKPLPIPGFSYVVPRFAGEIDLPDEMFSKGSPDVSYAIAAMPSADTPDRNLTAQERVQAQTGKEPHSTRKEAPKEAGLQKQPSAHTTPRPASSSELHTVEHSIPQVRAKRTEAPSGKQSACPAVKPHEEIVHGARREQPAFGGPLKIEQAERVSQTSPPFSHPPPDSGAGGERPDQTQSVVGTEPLRNKPETWNKPETHAQERVRDTVTASSQRTEGITTRGVSSRRFSPKPYPGETEAVEPQLRRTLGTMAGIAEPLVLTSRTQIWDDQSVQTVPGTGSFRAAGRPGPGSVRGGRESTQNHHAPWPDTSSNAAPDPSLTQPQVTVVKQSLETGTPVAYWERRYLSRLRVRVRR